MMKNKRDEHSAYESFSHSCFYQQYDLECDEKTVENTYATFYAIIITNKKATW